MKFLQLPIELWTPKCLSYLASRVGRPLYADAVTELHQRLGYARVCVEVGFDDEFPDSLVFFFFFWGTLVVELPDGKTLEVGIEYPWKPENVCIAKRWVTYPNSVRLNIPRLGFPRIMVRLTGPPSSPKKSVARCRGISVSPNRFGPL